MYKVRLYLKYKYSKKESHDIMSEMPIVPKMEELITIKNGDNFENFKVTFIQHFFDNTEKYMYIMITAYEE